MRLNSEVCAKGFCWICFESQGVSNTGGLRIDVGLECYREEMMLLLLIDLCLLIMIYLFLLFSTCMLNYLVYPIYPCSTY
ncbi:hypothetical protein MKW92_037042 [Papaver armeniacum]|nr:hypothetical protein MKW92_037042 [Papaver armeniacum]